jgi:hypothetical protein
MEDWLSSSAIAATVWRSLQALILIALVPVTLPGTVLSTYLIPLSISFNARLEALQHIPEL